jgi:hypothetical protein
MIWAIPFSVHGCRNTNLFRLSWSRSIHGCCNFSSPFVKNKFVINLFLWKFPHVVLRTHSLLICL